MVKNDLSARVVVFLLILTILVTMVGTWLTLTSLTTARKSSPPNQTTEASVSFELIEPPETDNTETTDNGG